MSPSIPLIPFPLWMYVITVPFLGLLIWLKKRATTEYDRLDATVEDVYRRNH